MHDVISDSGSPQDDGIGLDIVVRRGTHDPGSSSVRTLLRPVQREAAEEVEAPD